MNDELEADAVTLKVNAAADGLVESDLLLRIGIRLGGRPLVEGAATLWDPLSPANGFVKDI